MSKVYIKIDDRNRVIACDGGYTVANCTPISDWILIDEGTGDKYNLCQSNYFDDLRTKDGYYRYKYVNGKCILRSSEEITLDRLADIGTSGPSLEERINDLEIALCEIVDAMG